MVSRNAILTGAVTGVVTALVAAWVTGGFQKGTPAAMLFGWLPDLDTRGPTETVPPTEPTAVTVDG